MLGGSHQASANKSKLYKYINIYKYIKIIIYNIIYKYIYI